MEYNNALCVLLAFGIQVGCDIPADFTSPSHIIPVTVLEIFVGFGGILLLFLCFLMGKLSSA